MKVKLGNTSTILRGGSPRPIDQYITNAENGINWIKIGDVETNEIYVTKTQEKIKPEGAIRSRRVKPGDFILSNSMSYGAPHILKIDGCVHDGWLVISDYEQSFDQLYLFFALQSPVSQRQFDAMATGSTVHNLNKEKVSNLIV